MLTQTTIHKVKIILSFCFLAIVVRLLMLQMHQREVYQERSLKNYLRFEKVLSLRGDIVDCNDVIIATNEPMTSLWWQGHGSHTLSVEQQTLFDYLVKKFKLEQPTVAQIAMCERFERQVMLCKQISLADVSDIIERFPLSPNILIKTSYKRYYPYQSMSCHLIGYLGSLSSLYPKGVMGLEKACEEPLHGVDGVKQTVINSFGKHIQESAIQDALAGQQIKTTLDIKIQQALEEAFGEEWHGAGIIMCPQTGAIRALLSRPTFDPQLFLEPLTSDQWNSLQKDRPFVNRALEGTFPPASLFKLVTATAALETHICSPHNHWFCPGYATYAGRQYRCNKKEGHGELDFMTGLAFSCNIPFFEIGKKISINTLADYAHRLGLGEPTGIILPEKCGLIPSKEWKMHSFHQSWYQGETLSAAIGQSYLLVTPIQMARLLGGIVEGYLVKPRILDNEPVEKRSVKIDPASRSFVKQSMIQVARIGSGRALSILKNITIYAKTGTGQVMTNIHTDHDSKEDELKRTYEQRPHGWFIAHVSTENHPPLVIVILLEHSGTSSPARAIAQRVIQKVFLS